MFFFNAITAASSAAQHLLKKDTRPNTANKHQVANFRDVDAGGEQIHGDGNIGQTFVLKFPNHAFGLIDGSCDLDDGIIVNGHVCLLERVFEKAHNHVGVIIGGGINKGFGIPVGVEVFHQLAGDGEVKGFGNHRFVEVVDLQFDLVGNVFDIGNLACGRVIHRNGIALFPFDAVLCQMGEQLMGRLMIDQPAVDNRFPIRICVDGETKDFGSVRGRRSGKADLDSIKIIDDAAVFAQVVALVAIGQFIFTQFAIQCVAAMGFIHDDAIVLPNAGGWVFFRGVHDGTHQTLNRGNVDLGGGLNLNLIHLLEIVNLVKGFEFFKTRLFEVVAGLFTQGLTVNHEKDTPETA